MPKHVDSLGNSQEVEGEETHLRVKSGDDELGGVLFVMGLLRQHPRHSGPAIRPTSSIDERLF